MSKGLSLCRAYFANAIEPALRRHFPALAYAAGLIGPGSEVLGFDTLRSRDHHWGPRAVLFLRDADLARLKDQIDTCLADNLPYAIEGISTNFGDPIDHNGVRLLAPVSSGPVRHLVEIHSVATFAETRLGIDPALPISNRQWLTLPQQRLLETTQGEVFRDDTGEITALRAVLAYFPPEVWLYMLASQWQKISQEEAFVGRTAETGDELGSRLVAARLVRELMRLAFLMERRYWPYSKWFGTAFAKLDAAPALAPLLDQALAADNFIDREAALAQAYEYLAERHNDLAITAVLETNVRPYHTRPFAVIRADRFAQRIKASITDIEMGNIDLFGSVDQFADSTEIGESPAAANALRAVYGIR